MRRWDFPVAPAVIGLILGPLAETQFRRALAISQGDAIGVLHAADLGVVARRHGAAGRRALGGAADAAQDPMSVGVARWR